MKNKPSLDNAHKRLKTHLQQIHQPEFLNGNNGVTQLLLNELAATDNQVTALYQRAESLEYCVE